MKKQTKSLDKYERTVHIIMQNSGYDSSIINLSISVKNYSYDIKLN